MSSPTRDIYKLPTIVLFFVGLYDVLRGIMHTYLLTWSAATFAKFDLATVPEDQVFMLGVFGISNLLTGFIYLLICWRARQLSPYVLLLIPVAYLLGILGIWSVGIHGQSAYLGRYFLFVYFGICVATFLIFLFQKSRTAK
jgi:hypothetical protein